MFKFSVDYGISAITVAIDAADADSVAPVRYAEEKRGKTAMLDELKKTIRRNGGLYKAIDPDRATPRDLYKALRGQSTSINFTVKLLAGEISKFGPGDGDTPNANN